MTLTELLIAELPLEVLLASLSDYVGERQANMLKEIVAVNELSEEETKSLIKEYIK